MVSFCNSKREQNIYTKKDFPNTLALLCRKKGDVVLSDLFSQFVSLYSFMDYSNIKYEMVLPNYGVHIQKMVDHTVTIADEKKRLQAAHAIIAVMGNLFPELKASEEQHKLWDHLAFMSDFKLNIEYPCKLTSRENIRDTPEKVPYNTTRIKLRHYGLITEKLIQTVINEQDEKKKMCLANITANHMKKNYLNWNKDTVEDQVIIDDLNKLSGGRLNFTTDDLKLLSTREIFQNGSKTKSALNNPGARNKKNKAKTNKKNIIKAKAKTVKTPLS